jgi:hypothetical protein
MSKPPSDDRCQFTRANGKPCRMPRMNGHASLCPHHARQHEHQSALSAQASSSERPASSVALDLLGPIQDFRTANSVNHVLGKLLVLLATERVSPRNAAVLAYICQLLLQSLSDVKHELWLAKNTPDMKATLKQILKAPSPGTAAAKFVDDVCKLALSKGQTEGPALVKSNGSAIT